MDKSKIPLPPSKLKDIPLPPRKKYEYQEVMMRERGREPPKAVDLEQVVLGAMMIDRKGVEEVIMLLKPEFFFERAHSFIYEAIQNLYKRQVGIDLLTVSEELSKMGKLATVGGDFYLIGLTQRVSSSAHIEFHARIIIQKYVLRILIRDSYDVIEKAFYRDPDIFDVMDTITKSVERIYKEAIRIDENLNTNDAIKELYDKVEAVQKGKPSAVPTGLSNFDDWCGGFHNRELITIAARPGMGKTTALLSIASKASIEGDIPGAFFSLEMTNVDLKNRLAAKATGIPYSNIRQGKLSMSELSSCLTYFERIDKSNLIIIDRINIHERLIEKIRSLFAEKHIRYVIIDYVQLIKLMQRSGDRTSDLSDITRDLKGLANELNIPIIIIAQLSRKVDTRTNRRPILSDLKQSGSIEEDSDTVIFIYREAYYQQEAGVKLTMDVIGKTEFIVAKGRNIGTDVFWTFLDFINYDFRSF